MAGADQGRRHGSRHDTVCFVKTDAFIPLQHGVAVADLPVPSAHHGGHIGDFVATLLTGGHFAAEGTECFLEKRLNKMGLQPPRFHAFHVFPHGGHNVRIHHVIREGVLLHQSDQCLSVERAVYGLGDLRLNILLAAATHGLDEQFPQGAIVERDFAKNVEYLAA